MTAAIRTKKMSTGTQLRINLGRPKDFHDWPNSGLPKCDPGGKLHNDGFHIRGTLPKVRSVPLMCSDFPYGRSTVITWVRVPKLTACACAVQYCPTNASTRAPCAAFSPFDPLSRQFQE